MVRSSSRRHNIVTFCSCGRPKLSPGATWCVKCEMDIESKKLLEKEKAS